MALPQVGLEAVIANLGQFQAGAKTITNAYNDINVKANAVEKATGGLGTALTGLGGSLLNIGAIAGGVALAGVTALGAGLATFATIGISKAIDLDQQMANIAATMGTAKEAVGPLKDLILDLALDPGLTVNTTQAASAIEKLAQNGLTASQIMDGAAKSTIALANATGDQGFTTSANIATGAMQAFNLEAKDLSIVADGVAGVLVKTKFNADDYALALSNAGEIAFSTGVSLQDFNTIIAATASSFTSGSDAGTSLKTLLQRFANPTDEAAGLMNDLGINVFDSAGKMRDMKDIVADLHVAFEDMTEQEKAHNAAVIGGADASRTLLGLAGMTSDEFVTLSGEVNKNGQALQMAATRVDSLSGAWAIFQGIIEAVQIQVGDKFLPILRGLTVGFTDLATKSAPMVVGFFGNIADTIATMVSKVQGLIDIFGDKGLAGVFAALGLKGSALFLKKLGQLVGMFGFVGDGATTLGGIVRNVLGGAFQWLGDNLFPILSDGITAVMGFITTVKDLFTTFQTGGLFGSRSGSFGSTGLLSALGISPEIITQIQVIFDAITEAVNVFMTEGIFGTMMSTPGGMTQTGGILRLIGLDDESIATIQSVIAGIIPFITSHLAELQGAIIGMGAAIAAIGIAGTIISIGVAIAGLITPVGLIIAAAALLGAAWAGNWGGVQEKTFAVWAVVQPILTQLMTWLQVNIPIALQFLSDAWSTILLPAITAFVGFLTGTVFPMFASFISTYIDVTSTRAQVLADTWTTYLLPAITGVMNYIQTVTIPFFTSLGNLLSAVVGVAVRVLAALWQNILKPALTTVANLIKIQLQPGLDGISKILGIVGDIIDTKVSPAADTLGAKVLPALSKGLEMVVKWIKDATGYFNGLASAVKNMTLPSWLQPGSPPPLAYALQDIANAANMAGTAMSNFSQATIDSLLGIDRNVVSINGAIGAARDDVEKFFKGKMNNDKISPTLKIMGQIFRDNSAEILSATDRVAKFRELISKISFNVNAQGQKAIMNAAGIWIHQFDVNLAKMKQLQQKIFIEAGRTALTIGNKLNDIVSSSVDILDERVKSLQELVDSGLAEVNFDGQILSALQAQEMLNVALAEQRDIQDDILQLKQNEQKLSFLEKQLSLVETLSAAGLDVNDILGGISLGLDASIPDMIAATNKLVMAMIEQVNKDLQMGSPSRVMMGKGEDAGMGFVEGLMASIPGITGAMKKAIFGPSLVSGPVLSGGSNSRVTNNNFSMNVNSGASPQGVMQQFEVARAMVG